MKKQIVISDIDFLNPEQDSYSSDNVVRNLLGNYYFTTKDKKYLWFSNDASVSNEKKSLIENTKELSISTKESDPIEMIKCLFKMDAYNKAVPPINQNTIDKLATDINKVLADSYYYKLSKYVNEVDPNDPDKLIKEYGFQYYYDYNMGIQLPILPRTDNIDLETINKSPTANTIASIEPIYNYFDKDFEQIANNNSSQSLYNFYALYYYVSANFDFDKLLGIQPEKQKFLIQNLLPLLKKYTSFLQKILDPTNVGDVELLKAVSFYDGPSNILKKSIIILPDAVKLINELENKKSLQPYGIEIQIPTQPKLAINTALQKTNATLSLEKVVLLNNYTLPSGGQIKFETLSGTKKAFATRLFIGDKTESNLPFPLVSEEQAIPFINLNEWVKNVANLKIPEGFINDEETIIFSNSQKEQQSAFLEKIKKFLLQKKIDEIIKNNKRSYLDMLAGASAYNEVLFFEIRKFDPNSLTTPLQSIVISNTENLDIYKYFDTQIAYDKEYVYDVVAWTLIIGNKYKYFDRIQPIPTINFYNSLKNNPVPMMGPSLSATKNDAGVLILEENGPTIQKGDTNYFKWFRILDAFCSVLPYVAGQTMSDFIESNSNYFNGFDPSFPSLVKQKTFKADGNTFTQKSEPNAINFSNLLYETYNNNTLLNNKYQKVLSPTGKLSDGQVLETNKIINELNNKFATRFADLLAYSTADTKTFTFAYDKYDGESQKEIISGVNISIAPTKKLPKLAQIKTTQQTEISFIYEILELFQTVGILKGFVRKEAENIFQTHYSSITPENAGNVQNVTKLSKKFENYLKSKFFNSVQSPASDKFLNGGYSFYKKEPDLNVEPNFGLKEFPSSTDTVPPYYPRFSAIKSSKGIFGKIEFGVLNYTDIILAGIPYIDKTTIRAVSYPPPPPDALPIPFKNVKNKIKFFLSDSYFTYRDYPIEVVENDKENIQKLLENEKYKNNDGKITFKGDEPSLGFIVYKLDKKPEKYTDFEGSKLFVLTADAQNGFEDMIEPNTKYYYMFRAIDNHYMYSNPSAIYEVEIVENSGAIYPIIKIVEIKEKNIRTKVKSIKDRFMINVNQDHILQREQIQSANNISGGEFGLLNPSIFEKKFKIRLTSKRSKKKVDINLSFSKSVDKSFLLDPKNQQNKK
jgi:hypothetical protein